MERLRDCDQWLLHRELMSLPGLPPETGIGTVTVGPPAMLPYRGLRKPLVLYLLVLKLIEACVRSISTVTAGVPELSGVLTADAL